jgi:hypothetical protein
MKQYKELGFSFICRFLPLILLYLSQNNAYSAACCARSSAAPFLILGDDQAQLNLGFSMGKVLAEPAEGGVPVWIDSNRSEVNQNYRIDGSILLTDRLQLGASANWAKHQISMDEVQDASSSIGDFRVSIGYEILPSWTYSSWRPQGYVFSVITVPTGTSSYELKNGTVAGVTGNGFYSTSFGSLWLKKWAELDVFFINEIHYSLPRSFRSSNGVLNVTPGYGGSAGVGVGYSPRSGNLRIGFRIQPKYDQVQRVTTSVIQGSKETSWASSCDAGLDLGYMVGDSNTILASYTDQTLFGPSANSNLSRIFGLSFQHRWER